MNAGDGDDFIKLNSGGNVTIKTVDGKDTVMNSIEQNGADNSYISGGDGDDRIESYGNTSTIHGDDGNDYIWSNNGLNITLDGGTGDDTISFNITITGSYNAYALINGAAGNDQITLYKAGVGNTVNGGTGNDTVYNENTIAGNVYEYNSGDGNDLITGFTLSDTLIIAGTTYSTVKSGNNLIVSARKGAVTLQNAATLTGFNIIGNVGRRRQ